MSFVQSRALHDILDFYRNMATLMPETAFEAMTAIAVAGPRNQLQPDEGNLPRNTWTSRSKGDTA